MTATTTIVEDYLIALLPHMRMERLEEGGFVATVPEARGVIANADTPPECMTALYESLERWVKDWSARGLKLPVVDGIDLNTPENRELITYHEGGEPEATAGPVFDNEEDFLQYLSGKTRPA